MFTFKRTAVFLLAIAVFIIVFLLTRPRSTKPKVATQTGGTQPSSAQITSTSPSPLDGAVIPPSQKLTVTFSVPLQNKDEFKSTIDPTVEYNVALSGDKKTVTITPLKPFGFSQGYTLHISSQTKFDNDKHMDSDKDFHFQTINYSGA